MPASGIPAFRPGTEGRRTAGALRFAMRVPRASLAVTVVIRWLDPLLRRLALTRSSLWIAVPFTSMTTTGARSRQPRTAVVLYFSDGADVILIASNYGGTRHPAWYHNLKAHPQAELRRGGRSGTYVAVEGADERERTRLFASADILYSGYGDYRVLAGRTGRRIPIMRLQLIG